MSSNIRVTRVCEHCGTVFEAQKTTTRFCTHRCCSAAHKARIRASKIVHSDAKTRTVLNLVWSE